MPEQRTYIAIDLKSFFASVECVERGLNPLTTNLVVADATRTEKTVCLAVSPSLKAYGIAGRARLFEVVQKVREVNAARLSQCRGRRFSGKSSSDIELKEHPEYELDYIVAPPRMSYYIDYSTRIYSVYLRYIAPEDIHVYSIDEVFMDVTAYLATYKMTAHELAMKMIRDVLAETGITATAGIGTNLYLCKVAMDIVAKHIPADADGVRIAELDEMSYRQKLWSHKPITDFWRVGRGIAGRLEPYGILTMGDIARQSVRNEDFFYKLFGVNAELLIDHAWGWEPCTMDKIKAYRPSTNSLSRGQVLSEPYTFAKARVVVKEMAETISLELLDKLLLTDQVALSVGYDRGSLADPAVAAAYEGRLALDHYGRIVPKPAGGMVNLKRRTSSSKMLIEAALAIFDRTVDKRLLVRRLNISTNNVVPEDVAETQDNPLQLELFRDYDAEEKQQERTDAELQKERQVQEAVLQIKKKFGKNSILKGMNFDEGATAIERNKQIGGHKA